jgi:urea transport system permease protein
MTSHNLLSAILITLSCLLWADESAAGGGPLDAATGAAPLELLASGDSQKVAEGAKLLSKSGADEALPILMALESERLHLDQSVQLFIKDEAGKLLSVLSLKPAQPEGATLVVSLNNVSRRAVEEAVSFLSLRARDVSVRRAAARKLSEYPDGESVSLVRSLVKAETDEETKEWMSLLIAKEDLSSADKQRRLAAARAIADLKDISLESELAGRVAGGEKDPEVRAALRSALQSVRGRIFWIGVVANTVYGLSLGSVLVLAALGLAITFGLMRVINMAHGEMLMLGAYSTFFVRELLRGSSPALGEWYLLFAIPFAFATTFAVGVLLERLVIRHLYGRPLETLLATWGLSLILIQVVRVTFGAQNVTVANPEWLSGGWEALPALVIPYSRIFVLAFTALVVGFVWFILRGTSVGLKVRAVTQNREIASSMGIPAQRIDMWTFGLGSGLAGLGGVALSQLGNVGPELGQQHIIDSFMVVVLGGVGNILGTISAGVGLGIANKVLEPSVGAVLAKILLLALLIVFIQWRPQGLFALKGRAAESQS